MEAGTGCEGLCQAGATGPGGAWVAPGELWGAEGTGTAPPWCLWRPWVSWPPLGVMAALPCHGCPAPPLVAAILCVGRAHSGWGHVEGVWSWGGCGQWWVGLLGGGGACGKGHAHIVTMVTSWPGRCPQGVSVPFFIPKVSLGCPQESLGCPQEAMALSFSPGVSPGCHCHLLYPQGVSVPFFTPRHPQETMAPSFIPKASPGCLQGVPRVSASPPSPQGVP